MEMKKHLELGIKQIDNYLLDFFEFPDYSVASKNKVHSYFYQSLFMVGSLIV